MNTGNNRAMSGWMYTFSPRLRTKRKLTNRNSHVIKLFKCNLLIISLFEISDWFLTLWTSGFIETGISIKNIAISAEENQYFDVPIFESILPSLLRIHRNSLPCLTATYIFLPWHVLQVTRNRDKRTSLIVDSYAFNNESSNLDNLHIINVNYY